LGVDLEASVFAGSERMYHRAGLERVIIAVQHPALTKTTRHTWNTHFTLLDLPLVSAFMLFALVAAYPTSLRRRLTTTHSCLTSKSLRASKHRNDVSR
jgi:hypothetical protein